MAQRILIVETDFVQRRHLELLVHRFGYQVELAASGEAALTRLVELPSQKFDLFVVELACLDVLRRYLNEMDRKIPIIVQVPAQAVETVPALLKTGVSDFIVRPAGAERLLASIKNVLNAHVLRTEIHRLNMRTEETFGGMDLIGQSFEMERVGRLARRSAKSCLPVLLEGEIGVGKKQLARAIHGASDRRAKPFVGLNCGRLPENLIFSSLFGFDKTIGKFAEAQGGTLFVEEISALPAPAQSRLMTVLQETDQAVADGKRRSRAEPRLIAATSRNLLDLVRSGQFREDLYFRLNVCPIFIPPLRLRQADISDLARGYAARFAAEEGIFLRGISAEALALLNAYDWPGNLRQLENALFRAVILAEADELTVAEFPQIAARVEGFDVRVPSAPIVSRPAEILGAPLEPPGFSLVDELGEMLALDQLEAEAIRFALTHYRGRMSVIARKLGIGRSTLYRKLKDHGLSPAMNATAAKVEADDGLDNKSQHVAA